MIAYFDRLEAQSKAIKEEVLRLCWYMRGGLDYNDAMLLSLDDRKIIGKIVKDNLENSKKSGMPFF
jgi:glutamate formiminotransferase